MGQADISRLVSKLRYNLKDRRKLRNPQGLEGRHNKIRKTVTALFKYERIELNYPLADESRGYAERLISDAIRYGECHKNTMDMASYWLIEKPLVHKLFKVLAPRYQNYSVSYTKMWKAPGPSLFINKCVLELRNNIYPPLGPDKTNHKNLLHNVLLNEARKAYEKEKTLKLHVNEKSETLKENSNLDKEAPSESDNVMPSTEKAEKLDITDNLSLNNLHISNMSESDVESDNSNQK